MRYAEPPETDRAGLAAALASGDTAAIAEAVVGLTLHEPDGRWMQDACLRLLDHPSSEVRAVAITCLGHVARIHRLVDKAVVVPRLTVLLDDPAVGSRAADALDDISMFAVQDGPPNH